MPFSIRLFHHFPSTVRCDIPTLDYSNPQGTVWNLSCTGWRLSCNLPMRSGARKIMTLVYRRSMVTIPSVPNWDVASTTLFITGLRL